MIRRVLVANRGEIARRVFRTCHQMGIETVAIYSDPDSDLPHALEAGTAVNLPGSTPAETYLNMDAVLAAAKQADADAIHPGYGFLSENGDFARRVEREGLTWIGPSPEAIEIMGSKLASKELVESVGVTTLPSADLTRVSEKEASDAAMDFGYPVLVKASAGGGGKGMRVVSQPTDLADAIDGARREAATAFGDDTIFLEKYLATSRHIEIQVIGDRHGSVISLFERECSIQRRHQKILEEAPSPAVDADLRRRMGETAVRVAEAVGYVGAGTVEFLFQEGKFFFLEMNTRLQVEHPVTEMITGLDLVRLQIEVANGDVLQLEPSMTGHAIEARLYAEDPRNELLPVTGRFHRFELPRQEGLRVDSGIEDGSEVSVHYDPMLAKVIVHAVSRTETAGALASVLRRARIHGSTTNRPLLVRILEHPDFLSGDIDTRFLERHDVARLGRPLADGRLERLAAVAAALSDQTDERSRARVLTSIPSGWRNGGNQLQERSFRGEHGTHVIRYSAAGGYSVEGFAQLEVVEATPDMVELVTEGVAERFHTARYGDIRHLDTTTGPVRLVIVPRFPSTGPAEAPGSLHAPMPGRVVRVDVDVGDRVCEGQTLVILEAMKMEHTLRAPHNGRVVEVDCEPGDQVEAAAVLVVVEEEG